MGTFEFVKSYGFSEFVDDLIEGLLRDPVDEYLRIDSARSEILLVLGVQNQPGDEDIFGSDYASPSGLYQN